MEDLTKSNEPFMDDSATFMCGNKEKKLRKFSVKDTWKIARLFATGAAMINKQLSEIDLKNQETVGMLFMTAFLYAEKDSLTFLASMIDETYENFTDPEQYPMGSELDIIEQLAKSKDFKGFLAKSASLISRMPELQNTKAAPVSPSE